MRSIEKFGLFIYRGQPVCVVKHRKVDTVGGIEVYRATILQMNQGWATVPLKCKVGDNHPVATNPYCPDTVIIQKNWCYGEPVFEKVFVAFYQSREGEKFSYAHRDKTRAVGITKGQLRRKMSKIMGI